MIPNSTQPSSRHRLLETSADLFWTRGFRATTTRQIAAMLGLQQASLYHHVSSKNDLLAEICRTALDELLAATHEALGAVSDPSARLDALVQTGIRTQLGNQKTHATMAFEMRALSGPRRDGLAERCDRYRALVRDTIAAAQADGAVRRDVDTRHIALSLWNLMSWTLLWYRRDGEYGPDDLAARFLDLWRLGVAAVRRSDDALEAALGARAVQDIPDPPRARTADRVLDAAASLFRAKGYEAASAREIAAVLGIQKASLYHHTRGKGRLLYQVCARSQAQMRADVSTAIEGVDDPLARLRGLAVAHVSTLLRHQDQHATSLLEFRALSGEDRRTIAGLRDEHEGLVRSVIEAARQAGVVRDDVAVNLLSLFLFSLTNRSMLWFRPEGPLSAEQLGRLFASLYLEGVATVPSNPSHGARLSS